MQIILFDDIHKDELPKAFTTELENYGQLIKYEYKFNKDIDLSDILLENISQDAIKSIEHNFVTIGINTGCQIANFFANKYSDRCGGLYLIENTASIKKTQVPTFLFNRLSLDPDIMLDKKDSIESTLLDHCKSNVDKFVHDKELRLISKSIVRSHWYPESIDKKGSLLETNLDDILDIILKNLYGHIPKSTAKPKKVAKRIILITGASGSGKTTLGSRLKEMFKDFVIIDSDDIDDESFLELYKNNPTFKQQIIDNANNWYDMKYDMTMKKRDHILEQNKDKTIVFVGHTISLSDVIHEGYHLTIDDETNFKRLNIRTLDDICSNLEEIKKLFEEEHPNAVDRLTLFKYKIRHGFPIPFIDVEMYNKGFAARSKDKGYKVMTADEIIKDLQTQKGGYLDHNKEMYIRLRDMI